MATLTGMVTAALAAITSETRGGRGNSSGSESDDFTLPNPLADLYNKTVENFTPRAGSSGRKQGRGYFRKHVLIKLFLLDKPVEVVPTLAEQKKITDKGLGTSGNFCVLKKSWTLKELEDYLLSLYPGVPLDLAGFYMALSTKSRKMKKIAFESVTTLKKTLNRGRLFIVPRSQLLHEENRDTSTATAAPTAGSRAAPRAAPTSTDEAGTPSVVENMDTAIAAPTTAATARAATTAAPIAPPPSPTAAPTAAPTSTDEVVEVSLPVINRQTGRRNLSRRQRNAAATARHQIRAWCNRDTPVPPVDIVEEPTIRQNTDIAPHVDNLGMSVAQLRQQQDLEYARSLHIDQQRVREPRERETREAVRERHVQQEEIEIQQLQLARRQNLLPEPATGFLLKLRHGPQRKFSQLDSIDVLINFIGSQPAATREFSVMIRGGEKINSWMTGLTLAELGVKESSVLEVEWDVVRPEVGNMEIW